MKFYSTKNTSHLVDLRTAVLESLPPDNGLYMPCQLPDMKKAVLDSLVEMSFQDIAFELACPFLSPDFTSSEIRQIVDRSINFPAPLVKLDDRLSILELWHGPSLAFKDFGARFMAELMSRLVATDSRKLSILVATSGDTGGAVAAGFLGVEHIDVYILFPKSKVSPLQERQLTCLGKNICAIEVEGTFDDCQKLVKSAFLDRDLCRHFCLSSANSINIARLLPQSFYYFEAYKQLIISGLSSNCPVSYCVPSGNFGNLTAGVMATRMALPVRHFIAATNVNDVVPQYLQTGIFRPRPSIQTISNAMDVGDPSNFLRLLELYQNDWQLMSQQLIGMSFDDVSTENAIVDVFDKKKYLLDPHGAVGYLASKEYIGLFEDTQVISFETAHPAKFLPVVEKLVGNVTVPKALSTLSEAQQSKIPVSSDYAAFKELMLSLKN